jgi:hypothetical protein
MRSNHATSRRAILDLLERVWVVLVGIIIERRMAGAK